MESTSYVFPFRMVLFYFVTTGWMSDIRVCENSIKSINYIIVRSAVCGHHFKQIGLRNYIIAPNSTLLCEIKMNNEFSLLCCMVTHYIARASVNRVRLPVLHVVS